MGSNTKRFPFFFEGFPYLYQNYNIHVKTHDLPTVVQPPSTDDDVEIVDLLDDSGSDDRRSIPTLEEASSKDSPLGQKEHQQFICSKCPFVFTGLLDLNSHIENQHNQKDFQCAKCNKTVRTNIGIKRHAELYCEECKLCLPERVSFDIHMGVNHKEKDSYTCERCGKTFKGLQNYENLPLNPYPYQFSNVKNAATHIIHH